MSSRGTTAARVVVLALLVAGVAARPEPPSQQYLPAGNQQQNQLYGPPPPQGVRPPPPSSSSSSQYLPPNQQYGPPSGSGSGSGYGDQGSHVSVLYHSAHPFRRLASIDDQFAVSYNPFQGPAQYMFDYMVNDQGTNSDFGHRESRDGDMTRGSYYVLLPDGEIFITMPAFAIKTFKSQPACLLNNVLRPLCLGAIVYSIIYSTRIYLTKFTRSTSDGRVRSGRVGI